MKVINTLLKKDQVYEYFIQMSTGFYFSLQMLFFTKAFLQKKRQKVNKNTNLHQTLIIQKYQELHNMPYTYK